MKLEILHADLDLLVVNKPAGIAAIPEGWEKDAPHLRGMLEAEFGPSTGPGQAVWVVHRLDKITSGVIVFARTAAAHRTLSLLFESHEVAKTYHALVCGVPAWDKVTARQPLRVDVGHSHRTAVDWKKGIAAVTHFQVRERFARYVLLEASPETGRTHQVRAHAAALGFPLLADMLYGAPSTDLILRPALHAYALEFSFSGKSFAFTAPYPDDFATALNKLRAGR
jgi:RluA family pseudouridine synthase